MSPKPRQTPQDVVNEGRHEPLPSAARGTWRPAPAQEARTQARAALCSFRPRSIQGPPSLPVALSHKRYGTTVMDVGRRFGFSVGYMALLPLRAPRDQAMRLARVQAMRGALRFTSPHPVPKSDVRPIRGCGVSVGSQSHALHALLESNQAAAEGSERRGGNSPSYFPMEKEHRP